MNQEALEVLKNRRSIRQFKAQQITTEELDTVLEAGTYAPTAGGSQAPVIIAVQDANTVAALDAMNAKLRGNTAMRPYYGAPTILLVMAPQEDALAEIDCTLIGGNLLNGAYAAGLGSCWIHCSKEMFETEDGKALLKKWSLPETMQGVCSIALGYADCPHPDAAGRKSDYIIKV